MQIVENKAVLFRTRDPSKYRILPHVRHLGEVTPGVHEMVARWGYDETLVLRNLGLKGVPSPINKRYTWPGMYKPMDHQRETAAFLTLNRKAFVFSSPGVGKTMSALWAADYLMGIGKVRRCLVLCPVSIMHSAWLGDIMRSIVHRSAIVAHHPDAKKRRDMIAGKYEFVVMNYDGLPIVAKDVIKNGAFDLVIVDEANHVKTVSTRRWKTLRSILTPDTRLWMMTGTPAAQSPLDAYGLAKLVNPEAVPWNIGAWQDKVMLKVGMFKWVPKHDAKDKVHQALQPSIRFTKEQCLDLPPVITETRIVEMTAQQKKYYRLIKEQMLAHTAGVTISAVNKAAVVSKLLQISSGAALTDTQEVVEFDATPRLNVLLEAIEETDRKVLVFALFRSAIETVASFLQSKGISAEQIHGDVPPSKRGEIITKFQNAPDPRVLVLQPATTAHGITLTAADTVIFYGPLMSVEQYIQCIARSDRKGQDAEKVTVIHIESSPIEEKMFAALKAKVTDSDLLSKLFDTEIK